MNSLQKYSPLLLCGLFVACAETAPPTEPPQEASPTAQFEPVTYTVSETPTETGLVETITLDGLGGVDKATIKQSNIIIDQAPIEPREPCTEEEIAERGCTAPVYSVTSVPIPRFAAPFQAQLIVAGLSDSVASERPKWELQHKCGAALIAEDWVITAAHCFNTDAWDGDNQQAIKPYRSCAIDQPYKPVNPELFSVRLDVGNIANEEAKTREIEAVYCRDYQISPVAGDIALVKLKPEPQPADAETIVYVSDPVHGQGVYGRSQSARSAPFLVKGLADGAQTLIATRALGSGMIGAASEQVFSWDPKTGAQRNWRKYVSGETSLLEDGRLLLLQGPTVMIDHGSAGRAFQSFQASEIVTGARLAHNGRKLLIWTMAQDQVTEAIEIWDVRLGTREHVLAVPAALDDQYGGPLIFDVRRAHAGAIIALSRTGEIHLWQAPKTRSSGYADPVHFKYHEAFGEIQSWQLPKRAVTTWPFLSRDRKTLFALSTGAGGLVRIKVKTGEAETLDIPSEIFRAEYSESSNRLATIGRGQPFQYPDRPNFTYNARRVQLWNGTTGDELATYEHRGQINAMGFSENGKRFFVLNDANQITVWNASSGALLAEVSPEETIKLSGATFLQANGKRLLAASHEDGVSFIWKIDEADSPPMRIDHNLPVTHLSVVDDGRILLTGGAFGNAGAWNLETGEAIARVFQKDAVFDLDLIDAATLMVSTYTGEINFWDLKTGDRTARFTEGSGVFDPEDLIEMETRIEFVVPFYAPDAQPYSGIVSVYGWGRTGMEGDARNPSAVLRMLGLRPIAREACADLFNVDPETIDQSFFCAFAPNRKTCIGDSGGPVLASPAAGSPVQRLVGVVSGSNHNCDGDGTPGFYTNVGLYTDWIAETICGAPETAQGAPHLCALETSEPY